MNIRRLFSYHRWHSIKTLRECFGYLSALEIFAIFESQLPAIGNKTLIAICNTQWLDFFSFYSTVVLVDCCMYAYVNLYVYLLYVRICVFVRLCVCVFVRLCVIVNCVKQFTIAPQNVFLSFFLSGTEYHSDADYNQRRVGVVVVHTFKNGLTFERLDRFVSYLEGSCIRVSRFAANAYVMIRPTQPAQPAYQPKRGKHA